MSKSSDEDGYTKPIDLNEEEEEKEEDEERRRSRRGRTWGENRGGGECSSG